MKKLFVIITLLIILTSCAVTKREHYYYIEELTHYKNGTVQKEIICNIDVTPVKESDGKRLEIYTTQNIYYIDLINYIITNESDNCVIKLDSFEELYVWISETTAYDNSLKDY